MKRNSINNLKDKKMKNIVELRIYKRLSEIRGKLLFNVFTRILESKDSNASPEKQRELIRQVSKPNEWVKNNFLTQEEKSELELLKFLIVGEDSQCKIKRYQNHIKDYHYHESDKKEI